MRWIYRRGLETVEVSVNNALLAGTSSLQLFERKEANLGSD